MSKYYQRLLVLSDLGLIKDERFLNIKNYFKEIVSGEIEYKINFVEIKKDNYRICFTENNLSVDYTFYEDIKLLFNTEDYSKLTKYVITFFKYFGVNFSYKYNYFIVRH